MLLCLQNPAWSVVQKYEPSCQRNVTSSISWCTVHVLMCVWFSSQKGTFRLKGSRCRRVYMTFISLKLCNKDNNAVVLGGQRSSKVIRKVTVWYRTSVADLGLFEEWCGCDIRPITRRFERGDSRPNVLKESRGWRQWDWMSIGASVYSGVMSEAQPKTIFIVLPNRGDRSKFFCDVCHNLTSVSIVSVVVCSQQ